MGCHLERLKRFTKRSRRGSSILLLDALVDLRDKFKSSVDDLEVGNALVFIVDVPRLVRYSCFFLLLAPIFGADASSTG
jgi:hypothetical protein